MKRSSKPLINEESNPFILVKTIKLIDSLRMKSGYLNLSFISKTHSNNNILSAALLSNCGTV